MLCSVLAIEALGQLTMPLQTKCFGKQIDGLFGQTKSQGLLRSCVVGSDPSGLRGKWNNSDQTYTFVRKTQIL